MRSELEKYGIQMPAFSKIGGILANEVRKYFLLLQTHNNLNLLQNFSILSLVEFQF